MSRWLGISHPALLHGVALVIGISITMSVSSAADAAITASAARIHVEPAVASLDVDFSTRSRGHRAGSRHGYSYRGGSRAHRRDHGVRRGYSRRRQLGEGSDRSTRRSSDLRTDPYYRHRRHHHRQRYIRPFPIQRYSPLYGYGYR